MDDFDEQPDQPESVFARGHTGEVFDMHGARMNQDIFDDMLEWVRTLKASDVSMQSGDYVWAEIGGKQCRITRKKISHNEVAQVLRGIYGDNGPGMVIAGTALDFAYEVNRPMGRMRFRMNVTCGRMLGGRGMQFTIRNLPTQPLDIKLLGLEAPITENLRPPQGLNLITGPTGSGKSTMLSSLIRWQCEKKDVNEKIIEYSAPIEYVYDGLDFPDSYVFQSEPNDHLRPNELQAQKGGSIWGHCITNALRRAPKIIIIGEARDKQTIEGCIEASLTGHLVMSTMHTIGVPQTVRRALMPFPADERPAIAVDMLECLNMVVAQLLLPKVGGGKVGCREYLIFNSQVRGALVGLDPDRWPQRLREMLSERKVIGCSMSDSATRLLKEGQITPRTFEWLASKTSSESKITRSALGSRWSEDGGEGGE